MSVWVDYFCAHGVLYGKRCDKCPQQRSSSDSHRAAWDIVRAIDEGRFRASAELRHDQVYGIAVGWDANGSPVEAA